MARLPNTDGTSDRESSANESKRRLRQQASLQLGVMETAHIFCGKYQQILHHLSLKTMFPRMFIWYMRVAAPQRCGLLAKAPFAKSKYWHPSLGLEGDTIAFVREHIPQILVPEVIYSWIDEDRTFLILKRVQGVTLRDAWLLFSSLQRDLILKEIASICDLLALKTSAKLQSVSEKALPERFLAVAKDGFVGPLTLTESRKYFTVLDSNLCPKIGKDFYLYHADLGPGNIMVSKDGSITGILDWEAAGFYPHFWIVTKPSVAPGLDFSPHIAGIEEFEWRKQLRLELENRGYPQASGWYMEWRRARPKK
ncbi:uncharacterized protein BDCG_01916 [Blastomyces dermatitidis ER-3]|uniref:Aminoglycoside phosphotransferase domain-containing protein n=1 Tax=Ajellomyces dermatitidis (strain ER-3 / ATCC MYA-2586) TaxID=559297 RepID=A0ABP2ESN6_AJEDR|nr:uncharacterized protein BDCG_01916 [Blastomyces dermatitidis ER-3]EEQ86796.2 hypothetical protein BDCG_01916 [Blastomyces dermatitidis ER-3]